MNLTGRKRKRRVHSETRDLGLRMRKLTYRRPPRKQSFEQTYRLEEVEGEGLAQQLLTNFGTG